MARRWKYSTKELQAIVETYRNAGEPWPAITRQIATWAMTKGLWQPRQSDVVEQLSALLSEAMRQDYYTDPQGRRVRAKHAVRSAKNGEQTFLWHDMRIAPRDFMLVAFQQRRRLIAGDCHQLKMDVDSYNQNTNCGKPIQLVLDFSRDVEEMEPPMAAS